MAELEQGEQVKTNGLPSITQEQFDSLAQGVESGQFQGESATKAVRLMEAFQSPEQQSLRQEIALKEGVEEEVIDKMSTTQRALTGAGAEMVNLGNGVMQLLGLTDAQQDERTQASQELFNIMDDQGFGAEDVGQLGTALLSGFIPGINGAKGAALASALMGGIRSEADNSATGRLGRAMFEGGGALLGGKAMESVGAPLVRAVSGAVESIGKLPGAMGMVAKGVFGKAAGAGVKEQQGMAIKETARAVASTAQRKAMNKMAEKQLGEAKVLRDEFLEQVGRMDARGKLGIEGGILATLRDRMGKASSVDEVQQIWTETFGGYSRGQMRKLFKTQGEQLHKMGQALAGKKGTLRSDAFDETGKVLDGAIDDTVARFNALDKAAQGTPTGGFATGIPTGQVAGAVGPNVQTGVGDDVIQGLQPAIDKFFPGQLEPDSE